VAGTSLAEVLRHFGPQYWRTHRLSRAQERAWRAIVSCRTPALGGQRLRCDGCGASQWRWNSCRNRHCPQCQSRQCEAWRAARLAELRAVPYGHLVFTLPHEINPLAAVHARWVYETVLHCAATTLTEFAANARWLGGIGAFTLVLHTWTQDLRRHVHVHALMACGALQFAPKGDGERAADGDADRAMRWVRPPRAQHFLFPVRALSKVFRAKFIAALQQAASAGALPHDPADTAARQQQRLQSLRRHDWVVYAKAPLAGPAAVLDYLSRYTHRTAIGNERLVAIKGDRVLVRVRADASGGKRVIAIDGVQFIARFLQHVLPAGFKRVRHFGLLAPAAKTQRLTLARQLLQMPPPNPRASEDAQAFMRRVAARDIGRCPHCPYGHWRLLETRPPDRAALAAIPTPACRGPPP
jgi:hypothetical protein